MKKEVLILAGIFLSVSCSSTTSDNLNSSEPLTTIESIERSSHPQGWVMLSFDITEEGYTDNIKVVESSPAKVFDKEAIRALSKWKYKPKIVDGNAERQTDLKVRLDFTLKADGN